MDRTRSLPSTSAIDQHRWGMRYHAHPAVPLHALPALSEAMRGQVEHRFDGFVALQRQLGVNA